MRKDFAAFRAEGGILPLADVHCVRLNKLQSKHIKANAALLGSSPSELIRFLMLKGAESYGIKMSALF